MMSISNQKKYFLSKKLKEVMQLHQITQHELASITEVQQPVISRMISGVVTNPHVNTLKPIADYFGLTINELLEDKQ